MNQKKGLHKIFVIVFILIVSLLYADNQVEKINPLNPKAGEFLSKDLAPHFRKAYNAYNEGRYELAAQEYLTALQYDITNSSAIYNLACCYGLMGNKKLATKYLKYAYEAGFDNLDHIKNDKDFAKVRNSIPFKTLIDSLSQLEVKDKNLVTEYFKSESYIETLIKFPENYDSTKSYPLIMGLHGWGDNAENFINVWGKFDKPNFIFACPEAPYPFLPGKKIGYSWFEWIEHNTEKTMDANKLTQDYVLTVTEKIKGKYNIEEIYLLGFSQGCELTYICGLKNEDMYDGLICFGGWLNEEVISEKDLEQSKDIKVFIAHGNKDRMVEFSAGEKARETLENYNYKIKFFEFEGGHSVSENGIKAAQEWFFNK